MLIGFAIFLNFELHLTLMLYETHFTPRLLLIFYYGGLS